MKLQHNWLLATASLFHKAFCPQTDVSNIVPTGLSQYIQLGTFSYWYKTIELTSYVYLWRENNGLKNILADHFLFGWFANHVIKNMIMQIMINLPKIFCVVFTMIRSVSVPNLKSFGQMKAEVWAKKSLGILKIDWSAFFAPPPPPPPHDSCCNINV